MEQVPSCGVKLHHGHFIPPTTVYLGSTQCTKLNLYSNMKQVPINHHKIDTTYVVTNANLGMLCIYYLVLF